jgi:polar amino acid transport system permease protein
VWVTCIRGVPVLVVMFVSYFAAPQLGTDVSGFTAVAFSLTIYIAAFYAEAMRGALRAIPMGQSDAGAAIGLTRMGVLRHVIVPQAIPLMVAPWLATSVIAVKSTAYASIVGVWELTLASREVVERTIQPFPVFFGAMLIYFAICFPLSVAARRLQSATGDPA